MEHNRKKRYAAVFFLLCLSVFFCILLNICIGTVRIPLSDVIASVQGKELEQKRILWDIRMPRAMAAMILGGALGLAGYLLQTFFYNPVAGPFILGISSGAKMMVALVLVYLTRHSIQNSSGILVASAFAGAMLSMSFVLLASGRVGSMSGLAVAGVMIGYICSAVTELIVTFADDAEIINLHNWSRGSFSGTAWDQVAVMAGVTAISFLAALFLAKPLAAYQLGEGYAASMGVNVFLLRIFLVIISSVLSGCIAAFAGPVSFVGVAVPHLVKSLLGTAKPLCMIPACFLGGSVFCLFCDLLARMLFAPEELSVSTVTAVFGAPVVLWVMTRRSREREL